MPTLQQLQRAVTIAEKIQSLEAELDAVLGGTYKKTTMEHVIGDGPPAAPKKRGPKPGKRGPKKGSKRVLSPEARAKIAEAQKRRWAKAGK